MTAAHKQKTSDPAVFGVGMWEYARTDNNRRVLMTPGLGPCIGIALHNPHTDTGYMAHLPVTWVNTGSFWEFIRQDDAINADTRAWLRGGQINYADDKKLQSVEFAHDNRQWAIGQLLTTGMRPEAIDAEWDDRQMGSTPPTIISLDADTGRFESRLGMLAEAATWFGEKVVAEMLSRQPYGASATQV